MEDKKLVLSFQGKTIEMDLEVLKISGEKNRKYEFEIGPFNEIQEIKHTKQPVAFSFDTTGLPLDEIRQAFDPKKYGWGELLEGKLKLDNVGRLILDISHNPEGRYDCRTSALEVKKMLRAKGIESKIFSGRDVFGIFQRHFWVSTDDKFLTIDATPLYPIAGALHLPNEIYEPEEEFDFLALTGPVPLAYSENKMDKFCSTLGVISPLSLEQKIELVQKKIDFDDNQIVVQYSIVKISGEAPVASYVRHITIDKRKLMNFYTYGLEKLDGEGVLKNLEEQGLIKVEEECGEMDLEIQGFPTYLPERHYPKDGFCDIAGREMRTVSVFVINLIKALKEKEWEDKKQMNLGITSKSYIDPEKLRVYEDIFKDKSIYTGPVPERNPFEWDHPIDLKRK